jgi:hypothetical protein
MPPAPVDTGRLLSLGAALAPLRACARAGGEEVLALYPEVGDREAQSALDACLDQMADLLREIDASASDVADRLRIAAAAAGPATGLTVGEPARTAPRLVDDVDEVSR